MDVPEMKSTRHGLRQWFRQMPGASLLQSEQAVLAEWLPDLFGYHIIQLGRLDDSDMLQASRITHKAVAEIDATARTDDHTAVTCAGNYLPLASDSVDVLLLPHVLEFESHPHQVLRECERVLIGEGHLLIFTFNPWSLWGLWRLVLSWRERAPWSGHFFSAFRLHDWLHLLGFEILETRELYYRPPLKRSSVLQKLHFMEKLGRWCWPWFGGVHAILARKHVVPLTPVRELWRERRRMIASGFAEPTAHRNNG
ncbi:MAG: methyltransferase domain-containing protein [Gammaproteobacteria bacterium]|nr:methyltransferase domain-containing protein [Gammaproteobacteria bacterium]